MKNSQIEKEDIPLELLYQEYARLKETTNQFINSSFSDFKLLAVIGLILAWPPIADRVHRYDSSQSIELLFGGFIIILCIFTIIGTRDLIKQSFAFYYHRECRFLEERINARISSQVTPVFTSSQNWKDWYEKNHKPIGNWFYFLCSAVITCYPIYILFKAERYGLCIVYFIGSIVFSFIAFFLIRNLYSEENFKASIMSELTQE